MNSAIQEHASLYSPANTRGTKVALYARVSMPREGEDPRAQHPENQLAPLRKYAKENGWTVFKEYTDKMSGAKRDRPGLTQLLRDARGHRFSLVLSVKVDRFARSVLDLHTMLSNLLELGVAVRFTNQPEASTDTPQGRLVLGILADVAEFERSLISSRTKAGIERRQSEGKRWGPKRKATLDDVANLREQGLSVAQIMARLQVSRTTVQNRLRERG